MGDVAADWRKDMHPSELMQVPRRVFKGNPKVADDWLNERQGGSARAEQLKIHRTAEDSAESAWF